MQPVLSPRYSLIIPVYRNGDAIADLIEAVSSLNKHLGGQLETIFVVDGSPDNSYEKLHTLLPDSGLDATLIALSRNFGAFAAIREGLCRARGQFAAVMAADLQEPPELVLQFFHKLAAGEGDIAFGIREGRTDPLLSRCSANLFWWVYRRFVQRDVPAGGVDVFAVTQEFNQKLVQLTEANSSLLGLLFWIGGRRIFVPYTRQARLHGKSAWTFRKKMTYLMDSIFAFTDAPIRMLLGLGMTGLLLASFLGALVVAAKLLGQVAVPGYAGTMLAVLFFGGLNAFGLGLVGNYAWRAYENTKGRPLSIPMLIETFTPCPVSASTN